MESAAGLCSGLRGAEGSRPFYVTSNRYVQLKNILSWLAVVFRACEIIPSCSLVLLIYVVRAVHKFDFNYVIM